MQFRNPFSLLHIALLASATVASAQHAPVKSLDPNVSLTKLQNGNRRFASGKVKHPDSSVARRKEVAKGQHPFAVVVTCSDSRLCPEMIFDQGLGDIFVVRVAGNTIDEVGMGSIEYAVEHLGARLVDVMGHAKCGAVEAAVKGGDLPGSLPSVVKPIKDAVKATAGFNAKDRLERTVGVNVMDMVKLLKKSEIVGEMVEKKKVRVVGLHYDLETGRVRAAKGV